MKQVKQEIETKSGTSSEALEKEGYKKTKLGWLPENWKIIQFSKVFDFKKSYSFSRNDLTFEDDEGDTYYIHYGDIHSKFNKLILHLGEKNHADIPLLKKTSKPEKDLVFLEEGDLVIADASEDYEGVGECIEIGELTNSKKLIAGLHTIVARDKNGKTVDRYRVYILKNWPVAKELKKIATGISVYGISKGNLSKLRIPLPPLPEQKKIAEILSTWDRAIETLEQLIAKKEELKRGLMQELLTPNGFENWKEVKVGKMGEFSKGKGVSKSEVKDKGIPAVRYGELYTDHNVIIKEFTSHINRESAEQSKRIQKGDILFAGSGETAEEIGKCAVFTNEFEAYAGGDIVILRPKNVNSVYLSYYLNSAAAIKQKSKLGQGHSVVHIYSRDLKQINIFLPDIEQQDRIVEIFATLESEIEVLKDQKILTEIQKKGLMQQLLTGKTRVKM